MGGGAIAVNTEQGGWVHLIDSKRKWYNNRRLIYLNTWIALFLITSYTSGYDGSMMNGLQSLVQWREDFNNPSNGRLGLLNAIQNIGSLAAYPMSPYVSDGIGRRPAIFLGSLIMCAAVALQTASQTVGMFIVARFLVGFGLTFAANAAPMLVSEVAYPPHRAPLTSLYNSLWYSGSIVAAWSTFGTFHIPTSWSWRIPSLLQGLSSLFQVAFIFFAPESPRWLISKGRDAAALRILAYYHADGNQNDPMVEYEFGEIKAAIEYDKAVAANVGWKSFWSKAGNRKRMRIIIALAFFSQWSGNGLVSYYLNKVLNTIGITSSTTQLLINGILQIWNLLIAITSAFLVDRLGRRFLFLTSCVGMLVFFTLQTVCSALFVERGSAGAAHAVIAFIFLFYAFYDIAFTPLIVSYTVEILPYQIRAKGFMIFNLTVSLSIIFNQYVNPIALGRLGWKYYVVYCCWIAFEGLFCYMFIIETKNLTLEETGAIFDGQEATQQISLEAAVHAGLQIENEDKETVSHISHSKEEVVTIA